MAFHRRVTLADVAARAGVSRTTASYVLNGTSEQMRISPETERRVHHARLELGYRPNRSALSLRTASTHTVGVVSDLVASGHFASRMLSGAGAEARSHDRLIVIAETEGDLETEARMIEDLLDRQVDGIVYTRLVTAEIRAPALLAQRPSVLLNCVDPSSHLPAVLPDELAGGRTAGELLLDAGAGDRVFVVGEEVDPWALAGPLRERGVEEALAAGGVRLAGQVACAWDVAPARAAVEAWLGDGARPTAMVCLNDRIAMGAYQALASHGLRVPEEVAVVSFDGSELAGWLRPALTSVQVPYADLGALAVRLLLERDGDAGTVLVPMPVLAGGSVRPRVG